MLPYPILKLGNLEIYMYGIMVALGILACFIVLYTYSKKLKLDPKFIDFMYYNALAAIAVGFGSAALFQATYNYLEDPAGGFNFDGGITFIGGLIGGAASFLIVYLIFRKKLTGRLYEAISVIPCCIIIAHAFGRIGCFFAGCCYGKPTFGIFGVCFPNVLGRVHPTQLYEAAFLFILFAVCSILLLKKGFKHNMSVYLISYGIFRFLIEFVRNDERGQLLGFITPSQFWSVLMVGLGIGLVFVMKRIGKSFVPVTAAEETEEEVSSDE